ncbi:MAG: hypothetical protein RMI34_09690 [Chloroherpetonaceae bacterium]|nr:hypothetical protein [Chloroherpetonaceae bacterium]MCS7210486.1 hypothetical protein [Chloroherpetonaceae bacterium]MDW8020330.1 hypothetical protein [Chloroherpetonaceae bacterium]MDW8467436.1 hypothetical protein [Chloroherpetonaceae bacterium]
MGKIFFLLLVSWAAFGCATTRIAPPRPIKIACTNLSKSELVKLVVAELRKDNFVVETADEEKGLVEAERQVAFIGIGENTLVLGPYAMNIAYQNDTVVVNFETVRVGPDGKVVSIEAWDERNASSYDLKHLKPVLTAIRNACQSRNQ